MTGVSVWETGEGSPLDVLEQVVTANDWAFDRPNDEELAVQLPGQWCDLNVFIAWEEALSTLQLTVNLQMRAPAGKRSAVCELLALINEKVWMGHFSIWREEGLIVFRHALPMRGRLGPSPAQMEDLVRNAIDECERFYPAFQFVVWSGKAPEEAMAAAMFDTVGEA